MGWIWNLWYLVWKLIKHIIIVYGKILQNLKWQLSANARFGLDQLEARLNGGNVHILKLTYFAKFESSSTKLTYWYRDKMATIFQTFSNTFSLMKMYKFRLRFHWSLFPRVKLTKFQHWFRQWLGAVQATSHYLNQWWLVYWRIYASHGLNEL